MTFLACLIPAAIGAIVGGFVGGFWAAWRRDRD